MREILFRGKDAENGQWIYGYYVGGNNHIDTHEICDINDVLMGMVEVDPATVGQFTGLTDKNGTKIFEGDFVKVTDDYGETNFPDGGIGDVGFYDGLWYVSGEVNNGLNDLTKVYYVEVIGNIHDNPELIKTA